MKCASYRKAIAWIVDNDDTWWLDEPNGIRSVTAALVADLFDVPDEQVAADLKRKLGIKVKK